MSISSAGGQEHVLAMAFSCPAYIPTQLIGSLQADCSTQHHVTFISRQTRTHACYGLTGLPKADSYGNRLDGLVVKASASRAEDPVFESRLRLDFSRSNHPSDLKIGTPVASLPGAWCYRVSAGTSQPGVSILWLGEMESLVCSFYLSVAAHKTVWADPSLRYTSMLLGRSATNK